MNNSRVRSLASPVSVRDRANVLFIICYLLPQTNERNFLNLSSHLAKMFTSAQNAYAITMALLQLFVIIALIKHETTLF